MFILTHIPTGGGSKAIDNDSASTESAIWYSISTGGDLRWVAIDIGEARKVNKIVLNSSADSGGGSLKDFKIYGSNTTPIENQNPIANGATSLHTETNFPEVIYDSEDSVTVGPMTAIPFSNSTNFRWYYLVITAVWSQDYCRIHEIELIADQTNVASEYVSLCDSEIQKTDTSSWSDINSGSATETLNSQSVYYWLALDPVSNFGDGTEIKIFNQDGSVWRTIAKNNGSTWEYNNAIHDTTKLLIHGDGADASTTIIDNGPSGHAFTTYGNAQIDTTQSKFGGSSLLFDGTGDYIRSDSASDDFSFGANDFTIDFWIRFNTTSGGSNILGVGDSANDSWEIFNASGNIYQLTYAHPSHTNFSFHFTRESTLATGQWYHIAFVRQGRLYRIFEDGILKVTSGPLGDADCGVHSSSKLFLGTKPLATPSGNYFDGWLDEVRFTKSALWTSNFTPPTSPHTYISSAANDYTGVQAETNEMLHAVSQAISVQAANRMTGTNLAAITDAQWEESGGWSNSVNSVVRGVTLYSNDSSQNPFVAQYRLNYDSVRSGMDLRSKAYDPGFIPSEGYIWSRIEHSDSDGPGNFYVSRNGGSEWTSVPMTQQGLPLIGDQHIFRGTVDITGQASGQDLRCRYETEQGKDQFLHSWGLQAKS